MIFERRFFKKSGTFFFTDDNEFRTGRYTILRFQFYKQACSPNRFFCSSNPKIHASDVPAVLFLYQRRSVQYLSASHAQILSTYTDENQKNHNNLSKPSPTIFLSLRNFLQLVNPAFPLFQLAYALNKIFHILVRIDIRVVSGF